MNHTNSAQLGINGGTPVREKPFPERPNLSPATDKDPITVFENSFASFFGYTKVTIEQPKIENGKVITDKQGNPKPDTSKRDNERVPLTEDIEEYFQREVKPHLPDSFMNESDNKVGYEINFTKYFYKYKPLRSLEEISQDLLELDKKTEGLMKEILV